MMAELDVDSRLYSMFVSCTRQACPPGHTAFSGKEVQPGSQGEQPVLSDARKSLLAHQKEETSHNSKEEGKWML